LQRASREGAFREDLFFRLNVIPIALPPLRDRASDIPLLVRHFAALTRARTGRVLPEWADDAMQMMLRYRWPGNVRELANIVERLVIMHPGQRIAGADVRRVIAVAETPESMRASSYAVEHPDQPLSDLIDDYERLLITRALTVAGGNVAEAARRLQTDRPNLYRRMKRLDIVVESTLTQPS
jgi:DNA-binding NtrC family response regulator